MQVGTGDVAGLTGDGDFLALMDELAGADENLGVVRIDRRDSLLVAEHDQQHATEPLPFGIYGEVLEGGVVRLGDPVSLEGR